jgi:outer membrane protein assembly factor BamB
MAPDDVSYFGATLGVRDGVVTAVDAGDGHVRWATPVPGDPLGGTTVVGDLVLTALLDGTVLALRRDDGEIVWSADVGGGVNGWMAVDGDGLLVPVGLSDPPQLVWWRLPGS